MSSKRIENFITTLTRYVEGEKYLDVDQKAKMQRFIRDNLKELQISSHLSKEVFTRIKSSSSSIDKKNFLEYSTFSHLKKEMIMNIGEEIYDNSYSHFDENEYEFIITKRIIIL